MLESSSFYGDERKLDSGAVSKVMRKFNRDVRTVNRLWKRTCANKEDGGLCAATTNRSGNCDGKRVHDDEE